MSALDDHLTNSRDRHNCDRYLDNTGECLWCEENHHARAELSALRAENARLREALEKIASETAATWVCDTARAALGGRDE